MLGDPLHATQDAGAARADIDAGDIKALLVGCRATSREIREVMFT
ncbi:SbtR family transcriptional regulator [Streptomyces mirabilis]